MNILYISYDGMTDPLGQSQVLPYLYGLSAKGFNITLLSAEKKNNLKELKDSLGEQIMNAGIDWHFISYTSRPPVLSTIADLKKLNKKAMLLHKRKDFNIVHCRSYIAALSGLHLKKKKGIPFIFDMRGFWADERVEGKLWNLKNPLYLLIYKYFKKKEKRLLNEASHIVCLTQKGSKIVQKWLPIDSTQPISVIPCCVDNKLFNPENINEQEQKTLREKFNLKNDTPIVSYLGSLGTWYMPGEMFDFFKELIRIKPDYKFLFITPDKPENILRQAHQYGIRQDSIIITKARREEVPILLSLSNVSLFFILPVFSKQASSPTKQAEVLSMGIPIICNNHIGDTGDIVNETGCGILVSGFNTQAYKEAINKLDTLIMTPHKQIRQTAITYFSLEKGVEAYASIYNSLTIK